jgi:hypothetical protein
MVVVMVMMMMAVVMPVATMGAGEVAVVRAAFGGIGRRAESEESRDRAGEDELGDWEHVVHRLDIGHSLNAVIFGCVGTAFIHWK